MKVPGEVPRCGDGHGAHGAAGVACDMCFHRRGCVPALLGEDRAADLLPQVVAPPRRIARGTLLSVAGEAATHVHVLHDGSFKSLVGLADGRLRIVGFHEPGDWLGLDGVGGVFRVDLVALEDSRVCNVDLARVDSLAPRLPALCRHLGRVMAQELVRAQGLQFALGSLHVRQRLVRFLLDLSLRHAQRGLSGEEFTLPMSREDLGDYLGFRLETVSRVFTDLRRAGLIDLARRHVRLRDRAGLCALLEGDLPMPRTKKNDGSQGPRRLVGRAAPRGAGKPRITSSSGSESSPPVPWLQPG